jgi:hypothetical protein
MLLIISQALNIVDQPSFRELMEYQRPQMKSRQLPHRTKITESMINRAEQIHTELAKELKVCNPCLNLEARGLSHSD